MVGNVSFSYCKAESNTQRKSDCLFLFIATAMRKETEIGKLLGRLAGKQCRRSQGDFNIRQQPLSKIVPRQGLSRISHHTFCKSETGILQAIYSAT